MLNVCTAGTSPVSSDSNNNSKSGQSPSSKGADIIDVIKQHQQQQLLPSDVTTNEEHRLLSYVPLREKIQRYAQAGHDVPFFSVEFFPPRTDKGAGNLIQLLDKFRDGDPYFCDITWHAAGNPGSEKPTSSITIAGVALNYCSLDTMLHVICIGLKKADLRAHLERAKSLGIRNILALRGDKHDNCHVYDFHYASDLVQFIREEYGSYFTIVVAGYPVPHPEAESKEHDLLNLKRKVDAGADVIITQLFFEAEDFIEFVRNCRAIGITIPIIPGICSINNYNSMCRFAQLATVPIPERIVRDLKPVKANDEAVRNYGVHFLVDLCRKLIAANLSSGLHFYTLNQDTVIRVIKELGLWKKMEIRTLPWRVATNYRRVGESIRSVFWINRPKSYIHRTSHWKDFSYASWSSSTMSSISESMSSYYSFLEVSNSKHQLDGALGEQPTASSLNQVFYSYYSRYSTNFDTANGETLSSISSLPWVQQANSHFLKAAFQHYGQYITGGGLLITNYLPRLNGLCSEDRRLGWGEKGGKIYQKEYLEFFLAPHHLGRLTAVLQATANNHDISYMVSNRSGSVQLSNWSPHTVNTLSWGSFPGYQRLIRAYVADLPSFGAWRDEAFGLFDSWLQLYPTESEAYQLISRVQEDYLLVSLIDNQFVSAEADTFKHIFNQLPLLIT